MLNVHGYTEIPLYIVKPGGVTVAYTSRGKALDRVSGGHIIYAQLLLKENESINESDDRLLYNAKYRQKGADDRTFWTPYFLSGDALDEYVEAISAEVASWRTVYLHTGHIPAPEYPVPVQIRKDEETGRIYCNIQTDPDRNGSGAKGKIFFPDRAWENAGIGAAVVSITREMDRFGFVSGHMVDYTFDMMGEILDALWEHYHVRYEQNWNPTICKVESPYHGVFYCLCDYEAGEQRWMRLAGTRAEDTIPVPLEEEDMIDARDHTVWSANLQDLFFSDAWDMDPGAPAKQLLAEKFTPSRYFPDKAMWSPSTHYAGKELDMAREMRVLDFYEIPGQHIFCCTLNEANLVDLSTVDQSVAEQIMQQAAEINRCADEAIEGKLRKGKLPSLGSARHLAFHRV